jgi:hypothetical protein
MVQMSQSHIAMAAAVPVQVQVVQKFLSQMSEAAPGT